MNLDNDRVRDMLRRLAWTAHYEDGMVLTDLLRDGGFDGLRATPADDLLRVLEGTVERLKGGGEFAELACGQDRPLGHMPYTPGCPLVLRAVGRSATVANWVTCGARSAAAGDWSACNAHLPHYPLACVRLPTPDMPYLPTLPGLPPLEPDHLRAASAALAAVIEVAPRCDEGVGNDLAVLLAWLPEWEARQLQLASFLQGVTPVRVVECEPGELSHLFPCPYRDAAPTRPERSRP